MKKLLIIATAILILSISISYSQSKSIKITTECGNLENGLNQIGTTEHANFFIQVKNNKISSVFGFNKSNNSKFNIAFKTTDFENQGILVNGKIPKKNSGTQPDKNPNQKTSKPQCLYCDLVKCPLDDGYPPLGTGRVPGMDKCLINCVIRDCAIK